jgi:hypothetical protein
MGSGAASHNRGTGANQTFTEKGRPIKMPATLQRNDRKDMSEEQSMVAERLLANLKELVALGRELEVELAPKPSWIKRVLNRISKMKTKRKETNNT